MPHALTHTPLPRRRPREKELAATAVSARGKLRGTQAFDLLVEYVAREQSFASSANQGLPSSGLCAAEPTRLRVQSLSSRPRCAPSDLQFQAVGQPPTPNASQCARPSPCAQVSRFGDSAPALTL